MIAPKIIARGWPPITGPSGSGCPHSSSVFDATTARAFSTDLASQARASEREVTARTLRSCPSKSKSKPFGAKAPSMNQSMVCAAWATCWAVEKTPSTGV